MEVSQRRRIHKIELCWMNTSSPGNIQKRNHGVQSQEDK